MRKENMLKAITCLVRPQAINRFLNNKNKQQDKTPIVLNSRCNDSTDAIIRGVEARCKYKP